MNTEMPIRKNDEVDLISFLQRLWSSRYVIILTTILFAIGAVVYALRATPIFSASAVITPVSDSNTGGAAGLVGQLGSLGSLVGMNLGQNVAGRESQAVLSSRRLTEEFIRQNDLVAALSPTTSESLTLWHAVRQFRELILTIRENEADGTTTVSINWTDPVVAAQWANEYVALANELIRASAKADSERNIEYLNEQLEQTNIVELQRVMYNLIETETKTLMLANARAEYAFTIVDPAVAPEVRSSPWRTMIVLSGVALGFFAGVLLAFAINLFQQIRTREQNEA